MKKKLVKWLFRRGWYGLACFISASLYIACLSEQIQKEVEKGIEEHSDSA